MIYNDHGLNIFLDKQPTFAVGAAPELSWHIIEALIGDEFDLVTCQEMNVDHGFAIPMQLF